jgi:hypothetical protein
MITALKIYNQQVKRHKPLGMISNPYKYFFRWRKSLINDANSVKDELPWITFNAIDYISSHIKSDSNVFEFGGGGSTLFFLKNGANVYTVEHDSKWFEILKNIIAEKKYTKWNGFFIEAEKGLITDNPDKANPLHFWTEDSNYLDCNFKSYATKIAEFIDDYFDVVLVDGRSRVSCIHQSIAKIKKGGLLVLDNSDRDYYTSNIKQIINDKFQLVLTNYAPSPYSKDFTHTTIWVKK